MVIVPYLSREANMLTSLSAILISFKRFTLNICFRWWLCQHCTFGCDTWWDALIVSLSVLFFGMSYCLIRNMTKVDSCALNMLSPTEVCWSSMLTWNYLRLAFWSISVILARLCTTFRALLPFFRISYADCCISHLCICSQLRLITFILQEKKKCFPSWYSSLSKIRILRTVRDRAKPSMRWLIGVNFTLYIRS